MPKLFDDKHSSVGNKRLFTQKYKKKKLHNNKQRHNYLFYTAPYNTISTVTILPLVLLYSF